MDRSNSYCRSKPFIRSRYRSMTTTIGIIKPKKSFPGPVSLSETTSPSEIIFDDDLYYHAGSGFNVCKVFYLDQYHTGSRGHDPLTLVLSRGVQPRGSAGEHVFWANFLGHCQTRAPSTVYINLGDTPGIVYAVGSVPH